MGSEDEGRQGASMPEVRISAGKDRRVRQSEIEAHGYYRASLPSAKTDERTGQRRVASCRKWAQGHSDVLATWKRVGPGEALTQFSIDEREREVHDLILALRRETAQPDEVCVGVGRREPDYAAAAVVVYGGDGHYSHDALVKARAIVDAALRGGR